MDPPVPALANSASAKIFDWAKGVNIIGGSIGAFRRDTASDVSRHTITHYSALTSSQYGEALGADFAQAMLNHEEIKSTFSRHYAEGSGRTVDLTALRLREIEAPGDARRPPDANMFTSTAVEALLMQRVIEKTVSNDQNVVSKRENVLTAQQLDDIENLPEMQQANANFADTWPAFRALYQDSDRYPKNALTSFRHIKSNCILISGKESEVVQAENSIRNAAYKIKKLKDTLRRKARLTIRKAMPKTAGASGEDTLANRNEAMDWLKKPLDHRSTSLG